MGDDQENLDDEDGVLFGPVLVTKCHPFPRLHRRRERLHLTLGDQKFGYLDVFHDLKLVAISERTDWNGFSRTGGLARATMVHSCSVTATPSGELEVGQEGPTRITTL